MGLFRRRIWQRLRPGKPCNCICTGCTVNGVHCHGFRCDGY